MADQPDPLGGLTLQDQKLLIGALRSLKNGLEVDYSKLAENMDWFMKDDDTKPNAKKANNAWLGTRKKLFPDGVAPPTAASEGGPGNGKASVTPRKRKDPDAPKTPRAQKTPAKRPQDNTEPDEKKAVNGHAIRKNDEAEAAGSAEKTAAESEHTVAADVNEAGNTAVTQDEVPDTDGDTRMEDATAAETTENAPATPITTTSIADDISAGSMSPTPAATKTKPVVTTPRSKAAPKAPKTPNTGATSKAASAAATETAVKPVPQANPKKRKTKAEKEAEAAAANSGGETDDDADGSPSAKKRKSADGKAAVKSEGDQGAVDADIDVGESSAKPTPAKGARKPSATQEAKREAKEKARAKKKEEKDKEKADKKAAKEREKEAKLAARKKGPKAAAATDGNAESSKPKTPRKSSAAQQAKKGDKEGGGKGNQADEDDEVDEAEAKRLALAAQEEINKQANDVFNGARIDKPVKTDAHASADDESTAADDADAEANNFIAINGNGGHKRSTTASESVKAPSEVSATGEDGETIAVAQDEMDALKEEAVENTSAPGT